jgi:hypothetical protein
MTEEQIRAIVREELAKTGGATSHSRRDTDHEPIQDADVRESLQVFHSGDAANLRIARIGDGYSDADMENPEAYLRRGGVIGNIEWYGGHKGRTGWWDKLAYPNGADGRVASIYCDAEEDFGDHQAATLSFATTRTGQRGASKLATRMQVRHDGKIRLLEQGHDETASATPYGEIYVKDGRLWFEARGQAPIALVGQAAPPPTTGDKGAIRWHAGSGFTDGWYSDTVPAVYHGSNRDRPPAGYTVLRPDSSARPAGI